MNRRTLLSGLTLLFTASFASAAATPWNSNKHGQVRLISEYDVLPASGTVWLGLHHQTIPGWHVYWKEAGDAGYAPRLNWAGSTGLAREPVLHWPSPTKFLLPGDLVAYGYEGDIVYPIEVALSPGKDPVALRLDLDYLTCSEPCVPYRYAIPLTLPRGEPRRDSAAAALIERARAQLPPTGLSDSDIQRQAPVRRVKESGEGSGIATAGFASLAWMLALAFLGGLILNVMPCVLPVLSIKMLSLLQQGGAARRTVVHSALASAAGILASFLALALVAIALKAAGHAVGWGTQFQNSWFVGFLFVVVLVFGLNLVGLFEIPMPASFGRLAARPGEPEHLGSHFMSGLFATLLATPCSAPFLGTAMGFALAQPSLVIAAIFLAAGAGLALPYFALAVFPGAVRWLPRPGVWMGKLKIVLGSLLLLTALWLGWVLVNQWRPTAAPAVRHDGGLAWVPFDEQAISRHLAEGRSVFVDITADWCFTCKYNEKVVLASAAVRRELQVQNLVLMQGDWTNRNETIARFLMSHGRAGIPFAAIYRPGQEPILLPEFLTEGVVLKALR